MARLGAPKEPKAPKPAKAGAVARPVAKSKPSGGSFVGLDIGTQMIKAVEVKGMGNGLTVTALVAGNTPVGAIQNGLVADPKALGNAVKQLLSKNGIRAGRVVTAATGADAVVVRVIEVPRMSPSELAETMKWEIERHIPFAASDVELSYQTIDDPAALAADPNNPNMEVLLAVARRDMVGLHLDTLTAAGLKPVAIDIEILAAGRALIDLNRGDLKSKNVVVVDLGASITEVGVFKNGVLRFPRTIPVAGDSITQAIANHSGLSMEAAEDEKRAVATVLMDLIQTGGTDNPFGDTADASPFDFSFDNAPTPPPFTPNTGANVFDIPETPASTEPENPFAPAAEFDPFANSSTTAAASDVAPVTGEVVPVVPVASDPLSARRRDVFDAILPVLGELSEEVRRSIDYFRSRYPNDTVDQIILCGGTARIGNLDKYMQQMIGVPTVVANPFAGLTMASKQKSPEILASEAPMYAIALGLAARDAVLGSGG